MHLLKSKLNLLQQVIWVSKMLLFFSFVSDKFSILQIPKKRNKIGRKAIQLGLNSSQNLILHPFEQLLLSLPENNT
jgi:hypothetical protein